MTFAMVFDTFLFFAVPIVMATVAAALSGRWRTFFVHLPVWAFGVWIPLTVFVLSCGLTPDWKGAAHFGALSCWITSKIWLTPMVLWGCVAFYVHDGLGHTARWVVGGLVSGAVASSLCALYGLVTLADFASGNGVLLAVPIWTAGVFVWRAVVAVRKDGLTPGTGAVVGGLTVTSLFASMIHAKAIYAALPDTAPECFVVTAASHGEPGVVGPFVAIERGGRVRVANEQLLTFWAFEARWAARAPRSHAAFRAIYQHVGPVVARRVEGRRAATVTWVLLRPIQAVAARLFR